MTQTGVVATEDTGWPLRVNDARGRWVVLVAGEAAAAFMDGIEDAPWSGGGRLIIDYDLLGWRGGADVGIAAAEALAPAALAMAIWCAGAWAIGEDGAKRAAAPAGSIVLCLLNISGRLATEVTVVFVAPASVPLSSALSRPDSLKLTVRNVIGAAAAGR